ncbi:DUF3365 domain-containing protein [Oscillatoria sp. FACHB-1406]|nr:adenylate/guanylate cyclase domain-containing protein [Oscillatoria sp. FACHB-1406]MBD2580624.1 DUF3365 domain-containing protein [Oscillatoria sp. FACHB-1406]
MRRSLAKILAIFLQLLYRKTILVLSLLFAAGVGITLWNMSHLSEELIRTQALENASLYAQAIAESRTLYSSDVVNHAKQVKGITVTHDYKNTEGAIPLPATFLIELGNHIQKNNPGVLVRLYSDYPFPWRKDTGGARDNFERRALNYLLKYPDDRFTRVERVGGRTSFRYARADILEPSCVNCHNTHPDSPKRDWKVGDVRGILEIIQPLDGIVTQTRSQLKNTSLILGSVSMLAVVGIVLVLGRLQQTSKELELRVIERTAQLQQSNQELAQEREKSERLLLNILPPAIAAQLKEGEGNIARGFSEVTILFADITNFTSLSEQMSPIVLVRLLNEVFSAFDRLTEQHGIEKIKTIGDAYMAVGGLPIPRRDHAEAIAEMALDMQEAIAQFQKHPEWRTIDLQIRIGINTGAVVAGTIGLKKFTYDLWGDAVNVASRMESSSIPGQIQVAEATYKRLKDKYYFEERDEILIKGKGKMKTYWLKGRLNN